MGGESFCGVPLQRESGDIVCEEQAVDETSAFGGGHNIGRSDFCNNSGGRHNINTSKSGWFAR